MKKVLFCVLVFCFTVSACQNESYFEYSLSEIERGLIIIDYKGGHTVNIPSQIDGIPVTRFGLGAFNDKKLTSITIPDSIISIGQEAFSENKLTSVTIPDSVAYIRAGAFMDNRITSITIGSNVSIETNAFDSQFVAFYQAQGKRAGTYTLRGNTWSAKYR
jgi:hypothetical protein